MSGADGVASAWPPELERVAVAALPHALARRWAGIVKQYPAAVSRTASMNLIAYAVDTAASMEVSAIVGQLAAAHPIRAITVIEDDAVGDDAIDSRMLAPAVLARDGRPTCSEEVFLRASAHAGPRAASAVFGLLIADLPVYLWWRGPSPYGTPLFKLIAPFADKLIVDSMRFGDASAALDTVRRLAAHRPGHVAVADLNWKRIRPWRQSLAACFDDRRALDLLPQLDRCSVCFAGGAAAAQPAARATLMAGWLTSRVPALREATDVEPVAPPESGAAGRIESVVLSSSASKASVTLRRMQAPLGITARASDASAAEFRRWSFPTDKRSEADLLHQCLDDPSRDPIFEAALAEG